MNLDTEPVLANARSRLREVLIAHYEAWANRLTDTKGLEAMCQVNQYGYSFKDKGLYVWKNNDWWKTLAGTLQTDNDTRRRILHYHRIASTWFCDATVDALSSESNTTLHAFEPKVPVREKNMAKKVDFKQGKILGYLHNGEIVQRSPFPEEPESFEWRAGKEEQKKKEHTKRSANQTFPPPPEPSSSDMVLFKAADAEEPVPMDQSPLPSSTLPIKRQNPWIMIPSSGSDVTLEKYRRMHRSTVALDLPVEATENATTSSSKRNAWGKHEDMDTHKKCRIDDGVSQAYPSSSSEIERAGARTAL